MAQEGVLEGARWGARRSVFADFAVEIQKDTVEGAGGFTILGERVPWPLFVGGSAGEGVVGHWLLGGLVLWMEVLRGVGWPLVGVEKEIEAESLAILGEF